MAGGSPWEHPAPLHYGKGCWAVAAAVGSGDKGTWSSPGTELVAGTAVPRQEMLFAANFAPGEGIQAMQLRLLMGAKAFRLGGREGGESLQSSRLGAGW